MLQTSPVATEHDALGSLPTSRTLAQVVRKADAEVQGCCSLELGMRTVQSHLLSEYSASSFGYVFAAGGTPLTIGKGCPQTCSLLNPDNANSSFVDSIVNEGGRRGVFGTAEY
jgi:hypothetical protein